MYLPSNATELYENPGVCTSCCQNKITEFLEFPWTDWRKFGKARKKYL
jgi:hypothetical protein